jgi:hypothetical protein
MGTPLATPVSDVGRDRCGILEGGACGSQTRASFVDQSI